MEGMRTAHYTIATVLLSLTLAACGGDGTATSPPASSVVGQYSAMTFRTTDAGTVTDQLALGASLAIDLAQDGTTSGRLFVPGGGDTPGTDLDADLAGTWARVNNTIRFTQNADTFVRDMAFTIGTDELLGSATFGGVLVEVVLRK